MSASSLFGLLAAEMCLASAIFAGIILTMLARARGWGMDPGSAGLQHIHVAPTSRLGGAAVFVGFVVAVAIALHLELMPTRPVLPLLIAALPVQTVGLWEDITHRASPKHRLIAAVFSAALASAFAEGVITRLDLHFVDDWLAYLPFAVLLTCFMVAGACNAFNIIDGNNGLAGGTALLMFLGVVILAAEVGDTCVLAQAAAMTGALVGFLLWNYPKGKVFLGDAGAYFIGFMYAQLSIQLVARNDGVSAWFVIALAAYPIVETLFSIYRRKIVRHTAAMQPDTLHLHSLLYLSLLRLAQRPPPEERRLGAVVGPYSCRERRQPQRRANARVAPRLWLHGALCFASALLFYDNTPALIGFTLLYGIFYRICYSNAERLSVDDDSRQSAELPDRTLSAGTTRPLGRANLNVLNTILYFRRARLRMARAAATVQQVAHDLHPDESLPELGVLDGVFVQSQNAQMSQTRSKRRPWTAPRIGMGTARRGTAAAPPAADRACEGDRDAATAESAHSLGVR
jgi:UDP-N-acetylmuramyl pentapeptide phosphotransferase/UDP-N-acetylglucosamine-1-phosphate transferase